MALWFSTVVQYIDMQEVVVIGHVHTRTTVSLHGLYFQDSNSIYTTIIHILHDGQMMYIQRMSSHKD